jgi:type I restriction enzyme M protein
MSPPTFPASSTTSTTKDDYTHRLGYLSPIQFEDRNARPLSKPPPDLSNGRGALQSTLHTIVRLPNSVFRPYASIGTNLLFFEKGAPTQDTWFWEHRVPEGQKAYSMTRPIRLEHLADCAAWWGGPRREGREETERAWKVSAEDVKACGYNLDIKNPHMVAEDHGDPETLLGDLTAAEAEVAALRGQLKAILSEALAR